jgi:RNA polymerase sigma-70 factor (ECF subfamily)
MATTTALRVTGGVLKQELEELFREHWQLVYRTALSVLRNRHDAEDVLQNLFLKLFERELPVDLTKNPAGYLYRAAVNASLNLVRSRKNEVVTANFHSLQAPISDAATDSESGREEKLLHAITQLNTKAAEILILRYAHNYSDAEIGKLLGKSRGHVAVTLYRARARLNRLIRIAEAMEKANEIR